MVSLLRAWGLGLGLVCDGVFGGWGWYVMGYLGVGGGLYLC